MASFIDSYRSEWLKRRRSAGSLLVWAGGFFIPVIVLFNRFTDAGDLPKMTAGPYYWEWLYTRNWQFMALFMLPMGVILATSLVTQIEFRNNTWKQLHVMPQGYHTIFWAKLSVIMTMLVLFFVLFNIGIWLDGVIPALFLKGVHFPAEPYPLTVFLKSNGRFFVACLPIVALQYAISLQIRNVLLPIGIGIGLYVASMMAMLWRYGFLAPYVYLAMEGNPRTGGYKVYHWWMYGYIVLFIALGYILYLTKKDKS